MSQVLTKVRDVDPNNSDAVKDALSSFFQNLPKHTETNAHRWLEALVDVINRFPKYCLSHRNTIETHLAQFLDSTNYYLVVGAAKCGHALQQVRPSQEKTATPKTSWREQVSLLCEAAHQLIAAIFPNAVDVYNNSNQTQDKILSTTPLSVALSHVTEIGKNDKTRDYDVQDRHNLLCVRFRNVLIFLQAMLIEIYPVAKPIRPQTILDVLVRTLTLSTSGGLASIADVAGIKVEALRTLDALVLCLGANLLPFSPLVFRLAMQTLRWTSDNNTEDTREVRKQGYKSLTGWLTTLHCHKPESGRKDARGKSLEDELVASILTDITPQRRVVQLTMSSRPTKNLSKKAKRKLANTMLQESAIANHMPGEMNKITGPENLNEDVTIAALECLEMFLTVCGMFLKPATHKQIQERILRECYGTVGSAPSRLCLMRTLHAAARAALPRAAPPLPRVIQIFSGLVTCGDLEISKFCSQALIELRLQLHCSPPTISYALDLPKESMTAPDERKKEVSERNRAALEQLLGADKLQEVITIPDEPQNKKAKLSQDEPDNISVSSQSSVEISDDEDEVIIQEVEDDEIEEVAIQKNEEMIIAPIVEDFKHIELTAEQNGADKKIEVVPIEIETKRVDTTKVNIHEECTQIHANLSNDTTDGHGSPSPHSLEVDYDYPNTGKSKVTVLEIMDEDNLPSTNETDDIQITCGQMIKNSQEVISQRKVEGNVPKGNEDEKVPEGNGVDEKVQEVNGVDKNVPVENGLDSNEKVTETVTVKIAATEDVTVEDMLADFVDEVNEEAVEV